MASQFFGNILIVAMLLQFDDYSKLYEVHFYEDVIWWVLANITLLDLKLGVIANTFQVPY